MGDLRPPSLFQYDRSPGEDPLKKEMATHSHFLAWKIMWTQEPGRLQSMGSQRVRPNLNKKKKKKKYASYYVENRQNKSGSMQIG